jgi:hypothetical protein
MGIIVFKKAIIQVIQNIIIYEMEIVILKTSVYINGKR